MSEDSYVVIDETLDYFLAVLVICGLEVDEPVAHLRIVRAATGLQLDLHVVHHDHFLA